MDSLINSLIYSPIESLTHSWNVVSFFASSTEDALDEISMILENDKSLESEKNKDQTSMCPLQDSDGEQDKEEGHIQILHNEKEADISIIYDQGEEKDDDDNDHDECEGDMLENKGDTREGAKKRKTLKERLTMMMDRMRRVIKKEESSKKKTKKRETFKERIVKRMDSLEDGMMKRWDTLNHLIDSWKESGP